MPELTHLGNKMQMFHDNILAREIKNIIKKEKNKQNIAKLVELANGIDRLGKTHFNRAEAIAQEVLHAAIRSEKIEYIRYLAYNSLTVGSRLMDIVKPDAKPKNKQEKKRLVRQAVQKYLKKHHLPATEELIDMLRDITGRFIITAMLAQGSLEDVQKIPTDQLMEPFDYGTELVTAQQLAGTNKHKNEVIPYLKSIQQEKKHNN